METPISKSSYRDDATVGCQFCGADPCICVAMRSMGGDQEFERRPEVTVPPVHEIAPDGSIVQLHPDVIAAACGDGQAEGPRSITVTALALWEAMRRYGLSFDQVQDVCAVLLASVLQGAPAPVDELMDRVRRKVELVRGKVRLTEVRGPRSEVGQEGGQ